MLSAINFLLSITQIPNKKSDSRKFRKEFENVKK